MSTYELNIESRLDGGNTLRKFDMNGEQFVGVYGEEPFAIRVNNRTGQRVETKVSVDGTDVANGGEANAELTGKRWVIEGYRSLMLTAWPERDDGGAAFVFGREGASVAAHTHGNINHKGVIAVAIFTEGAPPEPVYVPSFTLSGTSTMPSFSFGSVTRGGGLESFSYSAGNFGGEVMRGGPAVGAGSFTEQRITSATGLRQPRITEILRVRYMWWDDLRARLAAPPLPRYAGVLGFPAQRDDPFRGINLGSAPRMDTMSRFV